jgi:D-tyrosyl-tRNA(Tyr) deacylase
LKVLLQRVSRAAVRVEGKTVAQIARGLLVFLAVEKGDGEEDVDFLADKAAELRIFPDGEGKMNRSAVEDGLPVLVVSEFTLAGATRKGRRPSFASASPPEEAEPLYRRFTNRIASKGLRVASGVFRANMDVELVNDGPVTLLLDGRRSEA